MASDTFKNVHADLDARERRGIETYGTKLRSDTPVDMLIFAYEEALDQTLYLRAELDRRNEVAAEVANLERQIEAYSLGDRPSSPPAAMLRDYIAALRRLRRG